MHRRTYRQSPLYQVRVAMEHGLTRLLDRLTAEHTFRREFDRLRELASAVPWTTAEYATALCRLENARRYVEFGEVGAARYELRLLRATLQVKTGDVGRGKS